MITVYYFAGLKEVVGKSEEQLSFPGGSVQQLLDLIYDRHENLVGNTMHVAVNEHYVLPDHCIQSGDIVAFIPPVSGG